jgi:hypothetical protein
VTLVAIHQPNFFPWLGYFTKLARADVFVILDDAQQSKKGGWANRVRLFVGGAPRWWTVPMHRSEGLTLVNEQRFADSRWRKKAIGTLQANYSWTPYFSEVFPRVGELLAGEEQGVATFNEHVISAIKDWLGLDTRLRRSSTLGVATVGTQRLVDLVQAVGGDAYLSGDGSSSYLEEERFQESRLGLRYMEYRHPTYSRGKEEFVAGLSILDALFCCGFEGVRELVTPDA